MSGWQIASKLATSIPYCNFLSAAGRAKTIRPLPSSAKVETSGPTVKVGGCGGGNESIHADKIGDL